MLTEHSRVSDLTSSSTVLGYIRVEMFFSKLNWSSVVLR